MKIASIISRYNRTRKYDRFLQEFNLATDTTILDVGFTNTEYQDADNFLEKNYPHLSNITALGIEIHGSDSFRRRYPDVEVVLYEGSVFPFDDNRFDVGWSNAVIEHVGSEEHQITFLKELRRTCRTIYFTTPNRYFPFEIHTRLPLLHYLPKRIFDKIIDHTSKKWASGDYMHLLSHRKLKSLLSKAGITQYKIVRNRLFGFTMDFSIIIK
ncbi:MAG: class I SAM-dependent methyltransferase [Tannerellaceae bacterium]|jgi:SAM-dependent methyltransferase|nr:class I SAM-dependent methyltransferase [Tannerellaceae bacterium]